MVKSPASERDYVAAKWRQGLGAGAKRKTRLRQRNRIREFRRYRSNTPQSRSIHIISSIVHNVRTGNRSSPKGEPMIRSRTLVTSLLFGALFSSLGTAQDLSKYRDFQFGMRLESVAKQIHMDASAAKTTHQRPAVIQTLQWAQLSYSDPAATDRSLRSIPFDFYNGELFKLAITYDPVGTDGLTTQDMVEAISAIYGPATKPEKTIAVSTSSVYEDKQNGRAWWDDAQDPDHL